MRIDDLRPISLFDGLTDDQLRQLLAASEDVRVEPGVELFHEGDPADFWYVLIDGSVELFRHLGRETVLVGTLDIPGRWSGGFRAWDEHGVCLATGVGATAGRALRVPASALRELLDGWFPFAVHLIAGLYGTARAIESTARQRQSLITLGTLAAGLAHELNNPASAAIRTVSSLEDVTNTLLLSLTALGQQQISAAQFSAVDELRGEVERLPAVTDALTLSDREEELGSWLVRNGVAKGWEIAGPLAAAGADVSWCGRVLEATGEPAFEPALRWVASRRL